MFHTVYSALREYPDRSAEDILNYTGLGTALEKEAVSEYLIDLQMLIRCEDMVYS